MPRRPNIEPIDNAAFMRWLDEELKKLEMSRQDLSRKMGVEPSHISNIATNRSRVTLELARQIALGLGIPPSVVEQKAGITDGEEIKDYKEDEAEIISRYRRLNKEGKEKVQAFIRAEFTKHGRIVKK